LEGAKRRGVSAVTRIGDAIDATDALTFVSFAKRFNLPDLPQAGSNDAGREEIFIEAALFDSGRPLLVALH
jgi:hypothetical protein